jgi:HlyD family secretion protein
VAHIIVEQISDAILVPIAALFRRGDAWAVFVVEDGRARERIVEIGARTTRHAVVISGLEPGERVILHPSDRVADGVRVAPRE